MKQRTLCKRFALIFSLLLVCGLCFTASAVAAANPDFEIDGTTLVKYHGKGGEVTVPDGIEVLGKWAFDSTAVTKVNLPETLKKIDNYCFFSCHKLTDITLPASLKELGQSQSFAYNSSLEAIKVAEGNQYFVSVDGVLFNKAKTMLLYYPAGKNNGGEYAIPNGTRIIGTSSISDTGLTAITIPASLTSVNSGSYFSDNTKLKEFRIAGNHPFLRVIDGILFHKDGTLIGYPAGREKETLAPGDFPAEMKAIGPWAFQHAQHLKNVTIPDGIKRMEWMCFSYCPSLESVTLPKSVNFIDGYAFADCKNLKKVTVLNPAANIVVKDDRFPDRANYNIFERSPKAVLCGYENSTAQAYAQQCGLAFESLDGRKDPEKINAYVTRCYQIILGRDPDEGGLKTWYNELNTGRKAAAEIIDQFVSSAEFTNKKVSNADAVEILYKAMLDRSSDPAGKADWVAKLNAGQPLQAVINGFCGSGEFGNLCKSYGITPGTVNVPDVQPEQPSDEKIQAYVARCYKIILGRDADEGGMKTWVNELNSGRKAAAEIIDAFVKSAEFQNKKHSSADAVEILYKAMLDRPSDPAGKSSWVSQLEGGKPLQAVINGFCGSAEFGNLCKTYGINPGTVTVPDTQPEVPAASDEKIQAFVSRCYKIILGRDADEGGMNTWSAELASGRKAAAEIIEQFVASAEFQNKKHSNPDAVEILYKAMLGRGSDAAGKASWVSQLENGQPLTAVINGFCASAEFKGICNSYGITPGTIKVQALSTQADETLSGRNAAQETPVMKKTENNNVTKVEIVNAGGAENENLGTAVQAVYVNEEKAKEFISRCYRSILGREASQAELDSWIGQMLNGSKTPDQIARGFLFSGEFESRNIGGEELVKILYRVYLNREADAEGLATWTQKLNEGTSLQELLNTFSRTNEFKAVVKGMAN